MSTEEPPGFFVDASLQAVGLELAELWPAVVSPGHPDWPLPARAPDQEWLAEAAQRNLTVIMRDKRVKRRPAELRALVDNRVRVINVTTRQNLRTRGYVELLQQHHARIVEVTRTPPAYYHLTASGLSLKIAYGGS